MKKKIVSNFPLEIEIADTFFTRFRGLMGRKEFPDNVGLLLAPCSSIHMCFMRFSIDAVYIDKEYRIIKIVENIRPWLGLSVCVGAWGVIELNSGTAKMCNLRENDRIVFSD